MLEIFAQRGQTKGARSALSCALVGHPAHDAPGLDHATRVARKYHDHPGTGDDAVKTEFFVAVTEIEMFARQPRSTVTTEQDRLGIGVSFRGGEYLA